MLRRQGGVGWGVGCNNVHENLGLESVMSCAARYIASVKDSMNPCKAYLDTHLDHSKQGKLTKKKKREVL